MPELADAVPLSPPFTEVANRMHQRSIWLGPKGTQTPLHRDPYHNLLCQVAWTPHPETALLHWSSVRVCCRKRVSHMANLTCHLYAPCMLHVGPSLLVRGSQPLMQGSHLGRGPCLIAVFCRCGAPRWCVCTVQNMQQSCTPSPIPSSGTPRR